MPLLDRGSNRGVAGGDVHVMYMHPHMKVNIEGIDRHQITDIPLSSVGGVIDSSVRPVIIVLPFYATIMYPKQFEYYHMVSA